jgi:light-regulated signal transduction histidine kinase (bacteriophytochrome)
MRDFFFEGRLIPRTGFFFTAHLSPLLITPLPAPHWHFVSVSPPGRETRRRGHARRKLDNAVTYSHPGGAIRIGATASSNEITLSVSDDGVGIPVQDLPRIFERFYCARSRELGGTGLGLSIVKHIAQLHGGRVEAESNSRLGTTIRVILPNRPAK